MKTTTTIPFLALGLLFGACTQAAPVERAEPEADDHGDHAGGLLDVPETVRRNLGLSFARIEARRVDQTLRVPGAFELRPEAWREYRLALSGRVELLVEQYAAVEVGQVLFRFQAPAWPELLHEIIEGEQQMATARAEIELAKAALAENDRLRELVLERIAALDQAAVRHADLELEAAQREAAAPRLAAGLELARTKLANAEHTREHALHRAAVAAGVEERELTRPVAVGDEEVPAYRTMDWVDVRAETAGVVESLGVTTGAFVESPSAVLTTVDPNQLRFRALALQADLERLQGAPEARIVPPREEGRTSWEPVPAELVLGLEAHPEERTLTVIATPRESAAWCRPGVSAFLEVVVGTTGAPSLAIPSAAVVRDGLHRIFFRRSPSDPDHVLRVEADLGVSDGRWVALQSGARLGDEVVLNGAYELKLALDEAGDSGGGGTHVHADGTTHQDH